MLELIPTADEATQRSALAYIKHWLATLRVQAPGAPVLLVGTHRDKVGGFV
jgi:hypothetical protein